MNQSIRRALSVLALVLLLGGTLAACGTSSNNAEPTVTREAVAGAPPTRTPTVPGGETPSAGGAASPSTGGGEAAGGQATIEVDMVDIAFNPAEVRIPANTDVTIHAVNSGALPHTLTIPDVADTGEVPAGSAHDLQVNLPPGEYPFHCAIPGHEAAGMVGTLIVEEGAAPAVSGGAAASPGAEGGQAAAPSGPVEVDMVDLAFNPTELTIPANTDVTIHAVNSGALPHTFTIPDVADTGEVAAGDSTDVVVNLPPGTYDFHCAIPGHEAAGMVGKLIVTEGGGAAAPQGTEQAVVPGSTPQAAGVPGEVKTEATPPVIPASPAAGQASEASPAAGGETSLPTTYEMDLKDIAFDPAELTIPANTDVTINLVNSGVLEHTFDIEDPKIESGVIPGGGTGQVVLNLPPGEYEYICIIPGHKDAGMVGKLTVVESGGAATPAASPGASPAASPIAQSVDLDMVELRFIPDKFEIPANTNVQINLSNSGNLPHNFSIKDQDVSVDLAAGDKTTFVLNLPAGTYEFFCDVPGHESAGMVGTLTVKEGAVASPTAAASGGGSANLPTTYEMDLKDIAFDPAELTIPANTDVTINLVNSGVLEHTFDIVDPKVESGVIPGGGTGQVVLNLPPGEYEYICIIPGHKDAGMIGKLTVK